MRRKYKRIYQGCVLKFQLRIFAAIILEFKTESDLKQSEICSLKSQITNHNVQRYTTKRALGKAR
ncbi:hypothetical protein FLAT13_01534 [Flavobacterium salmonis]|uniref:Uncharacterized protein n=1 Tax=Flavobacterium salmonis TaxID=2654844 RepID=A0A6V6YWX5_9FLAO|nr:hypothetical protein FLAT13_01534 [Flavobacterium salmonis]